MMWFVAEYTAPEAPSDQELVKSLGVRTPRVTGGEDIQD